jgi:hypothetical protein
VPSSERGDNGVKESGEEEPVLIGFLQDLTGSSERLKQDSRW